MARVKHSNVPGCRQFHGDRLSQVASSTLTVDQKQSFIIEVDDQKSARLLPKQQQLGVLSRVWSLDCLCACCRLAFEPLYGLPIVLLNACGILIIQVLRISRKCMTTPVDEGTMLCSRRLQPSWLHWWSGASELRGTCWLRLSPCFQRMSRGCCRVPCRTG